MRSSLGLDMSFSSPVGVSGVSYRGYLGGTSKADGSRATSEGNFIDGGQTLSEPASARKRHFKGSSGSGFLLESNPGTTRQPHRSTSLFSNIPNLIRREHKRRRKYDEANGELDGAGYTQVSPSNKPSRFGKSPVGQGTPDSVVMEGRGHASLAGRDSDEISPAPSEERNSATNKLQDLNPARQSGDGDRGGQGHLLAPRSDLEFDSVRLVNLALNLNESRRKSVNLGRASPGLGANERRSVSMMKPPASRWSSVDGIAIRGAVNKDLRNQLGQERRTSRHASSSPNTKQHPRMRPAEDVSRNARSSVTSKILPLGDQQGFDGHFSKSTLARAEKAKAAFELAAEYRRLLRYLPPLRSDARPDLSAPSTTPSSPTAQPLRHSSRVNSLSSIDKRDERSYNPLQCIRNRKLRVRERETIDPAAEGWSDVTKVKAWVDKVEEESSVPSFRESHQVLLPPFPSAHLVSKHGQSASVTSVTQGDSTTSGRWKKPRIDWQITPEELFADAYWLEQDDHKELIEDTKGNKILSPHTNVKPPTSHGSRRRDRLRKLGKDFSGRHSLDVDDEFTKESPTPLVAESRVHNSIREKHGQHHRHAVQVSKVELQKESQRRRGRRYTGGERSVSSSESDDWRQGRLGGRRSRHRKENHSLEDLDSALLEKQMLAMLQKEAEEIESRESSKSKALPYRATNGQTQLRNRPAHPSMLDGPHHQSRFNTRRSSLPYNLDSAGFDKREQTGFSTDELDTTATNSPQWHGLRHSSESARGLAPNLALSLSPPHTRQASPDRGVQELRKDLESHEIEANDFATADEQILPKDGLQLVDSTSSSPDKPKRFSSTKMLGSRRINENGLEDDVPSNVKIRSIKKDRRYSDHSRIREIFGGGRIEGILRNEVSRLGGFIWKRDAPSDALASLPTSRRDSEQLQSEDDRQRIRKQLTSATTSSAISMDDGRPSRGTTGNVPPKYNLPTFIPLGGTNGSVQAPRGSKELDRPISRHGAHAVLQTDRAMISTDPSDISLLTSPDLSRAETRNSEFSHMNSRRNSYGLRERSKSPSRLAIKGVRDVDSKLKNILGMAGGDDAKTFPVIEISKLDSSNHQDAGEVHRHWSISDSERLTVRGRWDPDEIVRIRALLLASGVKAQEIVRQAKRMEVLQPSLLSAESDVEPLEVSHDERPMVTAHHLTKSIDQNVAVVEESTQRLKNTLLPDLLKEISTIQDGLSSELTTEVRKYADEADFLSTELTTTHILAIKQLHDSIDLLMRRRRRRFRWIRRGGYVLLEWTLLGIMWWVWLIVVVIRLFRATIGGIFTGVRWLFWL